MNLIPGAIAVLAIPASLLLGTSTCVAGPQEIKGPPKDDIYHPAAEGSYTVPPELKDFRLLRSEPLKLDNAKALGYDLRQWQSDPSRIIYHDGRYHAWMIDVDFPGEYNRTLRPADGLSWILYMNSKDGKSWNAVGHVPLGPKGSCYDLGIEQANVLMHEGRFYLFSEAYTTNVGKYKQRDAGIVCLVADSPEGPWKQVGDLMLRPSMDGRSFDCDKVVNPRHVFLNGKWFMYYKGHKKGLFLFGSLYCPSDPLFGKPATCEPTTQYWGLQSVYHRGTTGWDVERFEWQFGEPEPLPAGAGDTSRSPCVKLRSVPMGHVEWTDGFWADRFEMPYHHEMYNFGHLLTAACVHHRATGKTNFLAVATKLADFLHRTYQANPPRLVPDLMERVDYNGLNAAADLQGHIPVENMLAMVAAAKGERI